MPYDIDQRIRESKQPKKRESVPKLVSKPVVVNLDPLLIIDSKNIRELGRIEGNFSGVAELLKKKQRQQAALKLYSLEQMIKDLRHDIATTHLRT